MSTKKEKKWGPFTIGGSTKKTPSGSSKSNNKVLSKLKELEARIKKLELNNKLR